MAWMSNCIALSYMDVVTYPYPNPDVWFSKYLSKCGPRISSPALRQLNLCCKCQWGYLELYGSLRTDITIIKQSATKPCTHFMGSLQWRHNGRDGVSNHQPNRCLLNRLFRRKPKKTSKLRATGLCAGNSPVTGEFPAQMASNAENVSIWWRHHALM